MMRNNDTDGSEDGQIVTPPNSDELDFSLSEVEDLEYDSSLNIKPPQPAAASRNERILELHVKARRHHDNRSREKRRHRHEKHSSRSKHDERRHREQLKDRVSTNSDEKHSRSRDRHGISQNYGPDNADRVLQDLRSRLLSKRNKHKLREGDRRQNGSSREKLKKDTLIPDVETEARRDRLLEAEREMARLKKSSRAELEARREMRREARSVFKRADSSPLDQRSPEVSRKRLRNCSRDSVERENELTETNIVSVSDDTEVESDNERSEEEERATDTESNSSLSKAGDSEHSRDEASSPERNSGRNSEASVASPVSNTRASSPVDDGKPPSPGAFPDDGVEVQQVASEDEKNNTVLNPVKESWKNYPPYYPGIQGCRSVAEFQCLNRIEEGTYGVVYRAKDLRTEEIVALKRLKMEKEKEGFPITSLREINTLLKAQHPNIVTVREIVVGSNMDKIFIVMDYVEHDLKSLMETMKHRKQGFLPGEIKCLVRQLLEAVAHLHDNWILHRDLKTSNLLLSHKGILKVGDFGLAREYGSPLRAYTPIVVTLWYRSPELLLGCKEYSTAIDMWSVGCIFAELLAMRALFPGRSEVDQLNRIFKELGTPNERIWPGYTQLPAVQKMTFTEYPVSSLSRRFSTTLTPRGLDLMNGFLTYDPVKRLTAEGALDHLYFKEVPLPIDPAMLPTWPAKSELGARRALETSPKPPSGGGQFKALGQGEDVALGFHLDAARTGMGLLESRTIPGMGGGAGFSLKF